MLNMICFIFNSCKRCELFETSQKKWILYIAVVSQELPKPAKSNSLPFLSLDYLLNIRGVASLIILLFFMTNSNVQL